MDPVRIPPPNMLQAAGTPDVRPVGPIRIPSDPVRILRKNGTGIWRTIVSVYVLDTDPVGSRQDPAAKVPQT